MGGNLFQGSSRISRDDFFRISNELAELIHKKYPEKRIKPTETVENKKDFGDIDILIDRPKLSKDDFNEIFGHHSFIGKGDVQSFLYENVQIDLIYDVNFEFADFYFGRVDFGNLLGRVSHKTGFKLATSGLYFIFREDSYQIAEVLVSDNPSRVLEFFGLNPSRFFAGFNSDIEVYDYVISSPYFNKDIYLLENRSNAARVRDRKRKSYHKFLEYINDIDIEHCYPYPDTSGKFGYIKNDFFFERACKFFDGFEERYKEVEIIANKAKLYKLKFNGKLVMDLTGLANKELGHFMESLREIEGFRNYILETDDETIKDYILEMFKEYQQYQEK
jgi:hypothetical protein